EMAEPRLEEAVRVDVEIGQLRIPAREGREGHAELRKIGCVVTLQEGNEGGVEGECDHEACGLDEAGGAQRGPHDPLTRVAGGVAEAAGDIEIDEQRLVAVEEDLLVVQVVEVIPIMPVRR